MIKGCHVDYWFKFGNFKNMVELVNEGDTFYKLNAFLNLLRLKPGTLQDDPECGFNFDTIRFSEDTEEANRISQQYKEDIMTQASTYIEPNFVESITITQEKGDQQGTGLPEITFDIILKGLGSLKLFALTTPSGLEIKKITEIDPSPFILAS
jgi:hypothetical protein